MTLDFDESLLRSYAALDQGADADLTAADLRSLVEARLVHWEGEDHAPVALDPRPALSALLSAQEERLRRAMAEHQQQVATVDAWLAEHSDARADGPPVRHLAGVDSTRQRLVELAEGCRTRVLSFNPGGTLSAGNRSVAGPLSAATLERGVEMRAVFLDSVRNDAASFAYVQELVDLGAQVRTLPSLPLRMVHVDGEVAVVPVDPADSAVGAIEVRSPGLVLALETLFSAVWREARPVTARSGAGGDGLRPQERHALVLWGRGHTDAAVAHRLGVSERTVRRISDALCERLDAHSRFELGARAVARGWMAADDLR